MNSTTLRGIFPDPKPIHRRNFVRENIKNLKEMDSFIHQKGAKMGDVKAPNKLRGSNDGLGQRPVSYNQILRNMKNPNKIIHKGVQTERPEDVPSLFEKGTLRYPSPSVLIKSKLTPHRTTEQGDNELSKNLKKMDLEEKQNYIKQNIKSIKCNKQKQEALDPLLPPPTYQKGVLPKYLKEKVPKEHEVHNEIEGDVTGLVVLPDEERKEYLRVARENYASLIRELNQMPVSNDTLKKRKRKMEIETELKRLDEVIKIFQKPKVFVKAD